MRTLNSLKPYFLPQLLAVSCSSLPSISVVFFFWLTEASLALLVYFFVNVFVFHIYPHILDYYRSLFARDYTEVRISEAACAEFESELTEWCCSIPVILGARKIVFYDGSVLVLVPLLR